MIGLRFSHIAIMDLKGVLGPGVGLEPRMVGLELAVCKNGRMDAQKVVAHQ